MTGSPPVALRLGSYSQRGNRPRNDDFCAADAAVQAFAVSDGIGGAPYGDIIARVACNRALSAWSEAGRHGLRGEMRMRRTIDVTAQAADDVSEWLGSLGSGATLLFAAMEHDVLRVLSIGDGRCYLLRDGVLSSLTDVGRASTRSNALDSALGYRMQLMPHEWSGRLLPGDCVLLCTDGVWSTQSPENLARNLIRCMGNPHAMARSVVEGSSRADNATAVVLLASPA